MANTPILPSQLRTIRPAVGPVPQPTGPLYPKRYTGTVLGAPTGPGGLEAPKPSTPKPPTPTLPPSQAAPVPESLDPFLRNASPVDQPPGDPVSLPPTFDYKNAIDEYYNNLNREQPTATDEEAARESARKNFQAYLDAINAEYTNLRNEVMSQNTARSATTRAINARSGLIGSDFGSANMAETEKLNEENLKALEAEKAQKVAEINGKIDQRARDEIAAKKAEALGNADKYIKRLEDNQKTAREDLKTIARSGAKLDSTTYARLQQQTGYDPLTFESVFNANKPVPEYFAPQQLKDGTLIVVSKTGEVKNLGQYDLPDNSQFVFAPDGTPFVFNKDTGEAKIAAGFRRGQFQKPSEKDSRTASQKEYEYAQGQGYKRTFMDYQKEVKSMSGSDLSGSDLSWLNNL